MVVSLFVALYPLSSPNHNLTRKAENMETVALYPLSSPNHNLMIINSVSSSVALYPLSSPNHNKQAYLKPKPMLRYILFHHQTTTQMRPILLRLSCVISSFITKPQLSHFRMMTFCSCVISSFITKPQLKHKRYKVMKRCVISSFITKPQRCISLCS